jgi:hypothetical protein
MIRSVLKVVVATTVALALGAQALGSLSPAAHAQGAATALSIVKATKVIIFHPTGTKGASVAGACGMGESLALNRSDAWRCIVGNEIYDPCFSSAAHATSVICDASPSKPYGIEVTLAAPLPTHAKANDTQPWILTMGDGAKCTFETGGTFGIGNQRANYYCALNQWIIGAPVPGKVWYAVRAQMNTNTGVNEPTAKYLWAESVASVVL